MKKSSGLTTLKIGIVFKDLRSKKTFTGARIIGWLGDNSLVYEKLKLVPDYDVPKFGWVKNLQAFKFVRIEGRRVHIMTLDQFSKNFGPLEDIDI